MFAFTHFETSVVNLIFYLLCTLSSRIQKCSLFPENPFPKAFGTCITLSVVLNHRICILRFRLPAKIIARLCLQQSDGPVLVT